jgi:hypothetical protein
MSCPDPRGEDLEAVLGPARLAYFTPVREYPPLGDRKASALLAAAGLMASVLLLFYQRIGELIRGPDAQSWLVLVLVGTVVGLLLSCSWSAFNALTIPVPSMPRSLAYYPDIAARPLEEYRQEMLALTHREALRAMLDYNYSLSVQSVARFRVVERSFGFLRGAIMLWLLLLMILTLAR